MKILAVTLAITGLFSVNVFAVSVNEIPPISSTTAVVIDAKTNRVVYNKNMDTPMEPASTTKIMTLLLALENLNMKKEVTIDKETPFTEGSRIYLLEGEVISVENLMYAMMTESANDCAVALAKAVSGSVPKFVELMNKRAVELGATNTNFLNPNGLHLDGHYSTAHDIALIAAEGMKNPVFRKIVGTYKWTVPATNRQPERYLYNTNRLIYDMKHKTTVTVSMPVPEIAGTPKKKSKETVLVGTVLPCKYAHATGIKTGYTSHAGFCLVSGAENKGNEWISVVLKSPTDKSRYGDSITLLEFAFRNYKSVKIKESDKPVAKIRIAKSKSGEYDVFPKRDVFTTVEKGKKQSKIVIKNKLKTDIEAPVKKGTEVGEIALYSDGECVSREVLVLNENVAKSRLAAIGIDMPVWKVILSAVGIIFSGFLLVMVILTYRSNKAKKRLRRERERARRLRRERDDWPY